MRSTGLRVESPLGNLHLPDVPVASSPTALDPVDPVLFGGKASRAGARGFAVVASEVRHLAEGPATRPKRLGR